MQRSVVLFLSFALVAIFVAGLLAIATPSDALEARVALDEPLERWHDLGGSDDAGVIAPPRVPADANAAPVYRRAFVELAKLDAADRKLLDMYTLRNQPQDVTAIASGLDAVVAIAVEASGRSGCEWNRRFYRTGTLTRIDLAEFDSFVQLSVAVAAHAAARADANDIDAAIAGLAAMRRMAGHALGHPHVTQAAMGLFIDIAAFDAIERIFRDREIPAKAAAELTTRRSYRAAMRRTLLTHGTACLLRLDDPDLASPDSNETSQRDRAKIWFLNAMCDYVTALDEPGPVAIRTTAPPAGVRYALVFLPAATLPDVIHIAATRNDMAVAAIKLRSHRALSGGYPDSWVIPTYLDSGVVLHYRRDGKRFVLSTDGDKSLNWRWDG